MAKKHINIQIMPETIAKVRFAATVFNGMSFQGILEEMLKTGLEVDCINRDWGYLSPEEKNKFCEGLDIKYGRHTDKILKKRG